jgi:hypothetical protein
MFMDELLGTEIDSLGNEVKIHFCLHENMSAKLTSFFIIKLADLLETGFATSNYIPNINLCRVIYITLNDEIIGLRIWVWEQKNTRIILTSIDKNYRRRGLLKLIAKYYDHRVITGNCNKSITFIHVNNTAMVEAAKQTGYEVEFLKMAKLYQNE